MRPVWNLQVAGQPEYFANGILVHNCVMAYVPHLGEHVPNARPWAGAIELTDIGQSEDARMRRRRSVPGGPHDQRTPEGAPWDLSGFEAQDDVQEHPEHGRRGNVRSWR